MTLQLEHIFARERVRRRKVQGNATVDGSLRGISERAIARKSWRWQLPYQGLGNLWHGRPRDADDTDTTVPRGRCYRTNGIANRRRRYFAFASIMRVICHCWAIDRILLTTQ